eukprot:Pgem_evm1s1156
MNLPKLLMSLSLVVSANGLSEKLSDDEIKDLSFQALQYSISTVANAMAQAGTSLTNCYFSAGKGVCPRAMPNKCISECLVTDCKAHQIQTGINVGTSLLGATLPWLDAIINPNDVKSDDITDNVQASLG